MREIAVVTRGGEVMMIGGGGSRLDRLLPSITSPHRMLGKVATPYYMQRWPHGVDKRDVQQENYVLLG